MAIRKEVKLDLIDDNPYNPRKHYAQAKIREMAGSLQEIGLRQVPEGREIDGRVQLAYGHMRLRGYRYNQKHLKSDGWEEMPVAIQGISDADMFHFAMEENLRRTDITPIEVARCIEAYNTAFPEVSDENIAKKHSMTAANVSNMKRVLRLPAKFLGKIDEGIITFTQGRELLTLEGIPNAEELMSSALAGINTTGNKSYSEPNTVEGLQKSIYSTIRGHFPPLDKQWEGYRWNLLFDTRAAGCLKCDKSIITHPTKNQAAHYCTDAECWDRHDREHREKAAAAAKAQMEADILRQAAVSVAKEVLPKKAPDISQEMLEPGLPQYSLEKRGRSWVALDPQGLVIAIGTDKKEADERAIASFEPVATVIDPKASEYVLNHTYRISRKFELRKAGDIFDVTAQDMTTAVKALGVKVEDIEAVRVFKSSGKLGTAGDVSAGWSKCNETIDDISQEKSAQWRCGHCNGYFEFTPPGEDSRALVQCPRCEYEYVTHRRADGVVFCIPKHNYAIAPELKIPSTFLRAADEEHPEEQADERNQQMEEARERANLERPVGELPCETCTFGYTCERTYFRVSGEDDRYICDKWECDHVSWALPKEPVHTLPIEGAPEEGKAEDTTAMQDDLRRRIAAAPAPTPQEIPGDILTLAREKAGTRAEVLDLNDICTGERYWRQFKQGYADLSTELRHIDEPDECLENCTHGFHYAFDSKASDQGVIHVCSDTECLAKKKGALTRQRNTAGLARKNLERKAIQEAIAGAERHPKGILMLIIYAQMKGRHLGSYYYGGGKSPEKWLWDKVSAGTKDTDRKVGSLMAKLDKLDEAELRKILLGMMFYYLADDGDTGSHQIKTELPLKWLGVDIQANEKEPAAAGVKQ